MSPDIPGDAPRSMPLSGFRVLDLSRIWAGPYCTKLLGDMGAQVIKMESTRVYDNHRGPINPARGIAAYPDSEPGERPWNRNGWFNCLHMGQYGITLDLTAESGREVFDSLVAISDVVIENFRYGSLARLGYSYEEMRKLRPDLVYVSMPAFGNTGPWKRYLAYGIGQEQLSGMAHITGYRGQGPMKSGINHGDPITGSHAAGAILVALRYRRKTGKGMFIDVSQQESAVALIGPQLLGYQMTGVEPERRGNRSELYAPHNTYRCLGEDRWVAIAATSDGEWQRLCRAMGRDDLARDAGLATAVGRRAREDEIDGAVSAWTRERDPYQVSHLLQGAGVPAAPVLDAPGLLADPHYRDRGTFVEMDHPWAGRHHYPGLAWKMSRTPGDMGSPAPGLGEHNRPVFRDMVGLTDAQVDRLEGDGVIGAVPTGSRVI
ncbi:MAG: CoA transferase [Dehalococcoidia bacterium]|nr:CoA transferase [Dehalococcoidia bacterium]